MTVDRHGVGGGELSHQHLWDFAGNLGYILGVKGKERVFEAAE